MKLIIAGSRHLSLPKEFIDWCLERFSISYENLEVVSGGARGIDTSGEQFSTMYTHIKLKRFPADWDKYGKAAGYFRNCEMAEYSDTLLLIWDGESNGSANMKRQMEKLNKPIYELIIKQDISNLRLY